MGEYIYVRYPSINIYICIPAINNPTPIPVARGTPSTKPGTAGVGAPVSVLFASRTHDLPLSTIYANSPLGKGHAPYPVFIRCL